MQPELKFPDDADLVTLRTCTRLKDRGDDQSKVCGWMVFDQVTILADVSPESPTAEGKAIGIKALSCRSCGALQPDGIPAVLIDKLTELEICKPNVDGESPEAKQG